MVPWHRLWIQFVRTPLASTMQISLAINSPLILRIKIFLRFIALGGNCTSRSKVA